MPGWLRWALWLTLWILVLAGLLWLLLHIQTTLVVFGLACLFSYLLNPFVSAIEGRRLGPVKKAGRALAVTVVFLILAGFLAALGSLTVPLIGDQVGQLVAEAPRLQGQLKGAARTLQARYLETVPAEVRGPLEKSIGGSASRLAGLIAAGFRKLTAFVFSIFNGVFLLVTALLISCYMLLTWEGFTRGLLAVIPLAYRDEVEGLAHQMNQIFGGYLKATILTSLACAALTFASLVVLAAVTGRSYPYILVVSLIAGITYPIPIVGILVSSVVAAVLAYLPENHAGFALLVLLVVNLVNLAVDRTLAPRLMGEAIGVSPLFVMFAAFAGAELMGIWGMLLGIPLAAMAKALFTWFHARFLVPPGSDASAYLQLHPRARRALAAIHARKAVPQPPGRALEPSPSAGSPPEETEGGP